MNGQHSSWREVNAGVPQLSILGPLLFLVYINTLCNDLKSNPKLFADDTSLFSVIHDVNSSQIDLNEDLDKINNWAYQWKMSFNPDPSKKIQEVTFSRKVNKVLHLSHLGMFLDFKIKFQRVFRNSFCKSQQRYCYTSETPNCVA